MTASSRASAPPFEHLNHARWRHALSVLGMLALCAYIDLVTGYEISVFLLYVIPVALATHWAGARAGVLTVILATGLWFWADHLSGHPYSQPWFIYVNAVNRMVCFLLAVAAIRHVKSRNQALKEQIQALQGEVSLCNACYRVCAQDDYWRPFDNYLTEVVGAQVHHKICPDCARRQYARASYRSQPEQAG